MDTGASTTAISDTDARRNNIPYNILYLDPRRIVGIGKDLIHSRILP